MCRRHKLTPLEIRHPPAVNGQHYVDVIFADGYEVNMAYDNDLTFEFYGTYPQPVSRGIPDFRHIAMCIQFLAADCDFKDVMAALHRNPRIRQAGRVIGAWAIDRADTATFSGRLLVLLELHTHYGLVSVGARTAVPGWFVYQERSYLVRSANRLAWCANASCRMDEQGSFHSMHTCPHTRCITCGTQQHTSVDCPRRQAQVAPKKSAGGGANNGNAANAQPSSHLEAPATRGRGGRGGGRGRGRGRGRGGARSGGHGHMSSSAERLARNFDVLSLSDTTTSDYQQL